MGNLVKMSHVMTALSPGILRRSPAWAVTEAVMATAPGWRGVAVGEKGLLPTRTLLGLLMWAQGLPEYRGLWAGAGHLCPAPFLGFAHSLPSAWSAPYDCFCPDKSHWSSWLRTSASPFRESLKCCKIGQPPWGSPSSI